MKRIIAFSGSNSAQSINQELIKIVSQSIEGITVEIINLRDYPAELFSVDIEESKGFPDSMLALSKKMATADGYIVSSPEHNGSMPAVLKNTIDWLSRIGRKVFNDKPTVFLSTSPGARGGASALQHLLAIMPYQGAHVIGGYSLGNFYEKVKDGILEEGEDKDQIEQLLKELTKEVSL